MLALTACSPKTIDLAVNVITVSCDADSDPFQGVTKLELRVSGPGVDPPLITTAARADGTIAIPEIPAGPDRVIEVRGLTDSGSRPVSVGRSLPIDIPDVVTDGTRFIDVNVFLRKVDSFTQPNSASAPTSCSRMRSARAGHTATLLRDGRVFLAGGFKSDGMGGRTALTSTEFYDPGKGTFEDGPPMVIGQTSNLPRAFHTATLLSNGQVLLYGGERYSPAVSAQTSALIFDVEAGGFGALPSRSSPANVARTRHIALSEKNGRVLIVGGQRTMNNMLIAVPEVEWFDPATNRLSIMTGEAFPRSELFGAAVKGGEVLVVGGGLDGNTPAALSDEVRFYSFDATAGSFVRAGTSQHLVTARRAAVAKTLSDDTSVLVMGGYTDPTNVVPTASSEVFRTSNNSRDDATATIGPRGDACAAMLPRGTILAVGGRVAGPPVASDSKATLVRFDSGNGTFTVVDAAPMKVPRWAHTCTTLSDGSVLVTGGVDEAQLTLDSKVLPDAYIYTPIPGE